MNKISKRELSKQKSINKIIGTTKILILEGNYFTTTTRRIARAAGVSIGLIYKYFPKGKPEIVFEICKREYSEFFNKINLPPLTSENIPKFIREFLKSFIKFHNERAQLIAALDISFLSQKNQKLDFSEIDIQEMNPIPQILKKLSHIDSIDGDRLEKINIVLLNTIESIIHRHVNYSRLFDNDDDLVDFLTYLIMKIIQY